ncbi:hypothetical protein [Fodinicurvata sediminis]|uniref:hypothetical protein n=1 Tax=Fodinicurvata sediminis TaxID=1121832 RepID=UPI0003B30090|nr:hypothetical protein [Fodinicurvata sediminis]
MDTAMSGDGLPVDRAFIRSQCLAMALGLAGPEVGRVSRTVRRVCQLSCLAMQRPGIENTPA